MRQQKEVSLAVQARVGGTAVLLFAFANLLSSGLCGAVPTAVGDAGLEQLPDDLTQVSASNLTKTGVAKLRKFSKLKDVSLVFCQLDKEATSALAHLPLHRLEIFSCKLPNGGQLTSDQLCIDEFSELRALKFSQVKIDGRSFFFSCAKLKSLEEIEIETLGVGARSLDDGDIRALAQTPALSRVRIHDGGGLGSDSVTALCAKPLTVLHIDWFQNLSKRVLATVGACKTLVSIDFGYRMLLDDTTSPLRETVEDPSLLRFIAELPALEECTLDCRNGAGSPAFVGLLAQNKKMKKFSVFGCADFDNEGCRWLAKVDLESLDCSECSKVGEDGLRAIVGIEALKTLCCGGERFKCEVSSQFLSEAKAKKLEHLTIINLKLTDLAPLEKFISSSTYLQSLRIPGSAWIGREALAAIAQSSIEILDLRRNEWVDSRVLTALQSMKKLRRLFVTGCSAVSKEDVAAFRRALPNCVIVG